jgi:hypothetical protein
MSWYQLTYANTAARSGRPGGWGVIQESDGMHPGWRDLLIEGVVTRIDEVAPTDEFAGRDELAARVRVFSFNPRSTGGIWQHAVVAGKDATGRPGNVFSHIVGSDVLDPPIRPVDLWSSPNWLMPFGAVEVASAHLGQFPEGRTPGVGVLDRAFEQQELTESLLGAVTHCFENDRALVLITESLQGFVDWLQTITRLTSHAVAARIPFTTFIRAAELSARRPRFEVLGAPLVDRDLLLTSGAAADVLVIDLADPPTRDVSNAWSYAGQKWTAGARWQDAFYELAGQRERLVETLELMDMLTRDIDPREQLSPEWPLALAMLKGGYSDQDSLIADWQRLQPLHAVADPELNQVLGGKSTSAVTVGMAPVAGAPLGQAVSVSVGAREWATQGEDTKTPELEPLLDQLNDVRPAHDSHWAGLARQMRAVEAVLEAGSLAAAVDAVEAARQRWALVVNQPEEVKALAWVWLRVVVPLSLRRDAAPEERRFLGDAALLAMGVRRAQEATGLDHARVDELLGKEHLLPVLLVDLLHDWLLDYAANRSSDSHEE